MRLDANWPKTYQEAVARLLQDLPHEAKAELRTLTADQLIRAHFGIALYCRNAYCLWLGNSQLIQSCAEHAQGTRPVPYMREFMHPDTVSAPHRVRRVAQFAGRGGRPSAFLASYVHHLPRTPSYLLQQSLSDQDEFAATLAIVFTRSCYRPGLIRPRDLDRRSSWVASGGSRAHRAAWQIIPRGGFAFEGARAPARWLFRR